MQVTDADGATATASFNLVRAALAFGVVMPLDRVFTVNQEITNLVLPAATGGTGAVTYTLTPELPAGLAFTAATRTLSGTANRRGHHRGVHLPGHRLRIAHGEHGTAQALLDRGGEPDAVLRRRPPSATRCW